MLGTKHSNILKPIAKDYQIEKQTKGVQNTRIEIWKRKTIKKYKI